MDGIEELRAREDSARLARHRRGDRELRRRWLDRSTGDRRAQARFVEHEIPDLDDIAPIARALAAPEHGAHPGDELARAERLGDVVVGPELEPEELVELAVASGQDDDRGRPRRADRAGDLEAVEPGETEVEHDEVWLPDLHRLHRRRAVAGGEDREARMLEVIARELDDLRLVIDDQDGLHRRSL